MKKERKERRRLLKYLTVALLVWPVMFSLIFVARAATSWSGNGTIIDDQLTFTWNAELTQHYNDNDSLSEENAMASASGGSGTLTLSATTSTYHKEGSCNTIYYRPGSNTITVTVTNASSFPLRFDKITHTGSAVVGVKPGDTLAAGGQFTVTLKASPMGEDDDTARTASDSITFTVTELSDVTLTAVPSAHGSYSVGGLTVAENGEEQSVKLSAGTVVTPTLGTVDDGYSLLGWRLGDGSLVAVGSSITMNADVAIYPVIMPTGTSITGGPFSVGGTNYTFWEDAVYAAVKSGSTIILAADHTLPDTLEENAVIPGYGGKYVTPGEDGKVNFLLPMGTKLLIPYSDSDIGTFSAETTKTTTTPTTIPSAYRVLTVSSGATITNYGSINVNSTQYSSSATSSPKPGTGSPVGPYGQIVLEDGARLDLESGSNLYCYGYITGKGQVHAKTGSNSYEMMQIQDWIGGNNALPLNIRESFLFSQYYVQNIEAPVVFAYNAKLYVSATLTLNGDIQKTNGELMGPTGMFQLAEGATLTRTYDPLTDRVNYGLSGDMVTANLTIAMAGVTMDTGKKIFGIQNNFTFNIESGSTMTLSKKFKLLPSCEINVKEGGTLTVDAGAELFIYDVDDWGEYTIRGKLAPIYYSPTKAITRTAADLTSACLRVDGTLVANGAVYSTSGGEGLTGTGVFVNNVSATRTTMPEIQKGSKEVKVSVQPVVGILAGLSTSGSDYTKKFSNPQTYYGTPTVLDNDGNILKESAWYQYAVNVAAPAGKDLCYGVVAYNADDGGAYSLGGTYETATIGSATISNVVGYVANGQDASGNSASGTFRFKVQGYTVNSISASKGTLTGPDANGVYSLTGLTTHSTLTIDASDPIAYTLAYVMSGDDYALYTANGGANTSAETVEIGGQTYYVLASYSGQAGTAAPIPGAPAVADRQLLWQYADKTVPGGTIDVNKFADGETTAYVYGFYRSNTAKNVNTGVQYTTFTEALVDAASGQEIRLLADTGKYYEEPGESWTWAAAKTITIDLNGHTITGAITNNGTMTIDLNGGTLDYHTGATAANQAYRTMAAVTNNGTLTIQDTASGGKITTDAIEDSNSIQNYISVVRNLGKMSIDGVKLTIEQTVNDYSAVVLNYNGGVITTINNASLVCTKGYGIVNYGGTIQTISGGSINGGSADTAGRYGIMNRNIRSGSQTSANPWTVSKPGTIETISGIAIYVYEFGIDNYAMINTITGDTEIKSIGLSNNGYAVYNRAGWYYDSQATAATTTESNYVKTTVYTYDTTNYPTINEISGNVTISSAGNYVFYNYGNINKISGDMAGAGVQIRRDNGAYVLINGGYIGEISGKVTIYSSSSYALAQNLWGTSPRTVGQTYIQKDNDQNDVYTDTGDVREYQYTYTAPVIDKIGGPNSQVTISGSGTALYNYGTINTITDGVTITARTSTNAVVNGTSGGGLSTNDSVRTNLGKDSVANRYETRVEDTRTFSKAKIGTIAGNVTIECPKSTGAVFNGGIIEEIGEGVTLKATGSVIQNTSYTYDETQYVYLGYGAKVFDASSEGAQTYAFTATTATITLIDGATVQATNGSSTLLNGGTIGTIQNSTISATGSYAIDNTANVITQRKIYTDNTHTKEYALTELFDAFFTENASTGKYTSVAGSAAKNRVDTYGFTPTITSIGMGNVISAAKQTICNKGQITTIDSGAGTKTTIKSTSTDTSGQAIYNLSCLYNTDTVKDGSSVKSDYLSPAKIGTIGAVVVTSSYRALQNGDEGAYLNVIDEIGTGAEITSTGNDAVYNASKNAKISSITGGIFSAIGTNMYALHNNATTNAITISGGDFKGGTNNDASLGRNYAIYDPDNQARQTYPKDMKLTSAGVTRSVTFANGTTVKGYYYLGPETVVAKFVGGAAGEFASLQAAVAAYPTTDMDGTTYIQMTDNSTEADVTIDRNVFLDLNGKTVTLTSGNGTLTINEGCTLHGMDHTTDGYTDTAYGKIIGTVSGSGTVALTYQTPAAADGTFQRYVKFADTEKNELSFHRYNISVSGYRFEFNANDESALYFQGTFSGSSTVKKVLSDIGFEVDGTNVDGTNKVWWTKQGHALSDVTTPKFEMEMGLTDTFTTEELKHEYTVYALLDFGGTDPAMSDPKTLSFWTALQQRYNELTAKDEASRTTDKEKAELAVLEQLFNGTSNTEQNTVT